jgi:hypothetical protein
MAAGDGEQSGAAGARGPVKPPGPTGPTPPPGPTGPAPPPSTTGPTGPTPPLGPTPPPGPPEKNEPRNIANPWVIGFGALLLLAFGLALVASLVNLWPAIEAFTSTGTTATTRSGTAITSTTSTTAVHTVRLLFGAVPVKAKSGTALLLLVVITGALGAVIHMFTSFADYVGNRRFYGSWAAWYLLRPVIGAALALLTYFALRGGFFSGSLQSGAVNAYGVAALSGFAGLFSKQATDKLREVFETLFRVSSHGGDAQRKDDLANPAPTIKKLEPEFTPVKSTDVKLKITGDGFVKSTVAHIDGEAQPTTFVNAQLLEALPPDRLLASEAVLKVTVFTGPPGGGESQPLLLVVHPGAGQ